MLRFQPYYFQVSNGSLGFGKKFSFLRKFFSQLKYANSSKFFKECHTKTHQSPKWMVILKFLSTVFRRTNVLSVRFKVKPLRKSVSLRQKPTQVLS